MDPAGAGSGAEPLGSGVEGGAERRLAGGSARSQRENPRGPPSAPRAEGLADAPRLKPWRPSPPP